MNFSTTGAIAVAPLTASVLGSVEERHVGTASGFNSAVARTGDLIATALGTLLALKGQNMMDGFHGALVASATAAASLTALLMVRKVKMREG